MSQELLDALLGECAKERRLKSPMAAILIEEAIKWRQGQENTAIQNILAASKIIDIKLSGHE